MPNHKGQRLGNYLLLDLQGRGSFGEVYMGTYVLLENFAAIKILQAHWMSEGKEDFLCRDLNSKLDLDEVLRKVMDRAIEVVEADRGFLRTGRYMEADL